MHGCCAELVISSHLCSAPPVTARITSRGSNNRTAHVSVNSITASRVCGRRKYMILVAVNLEKAIEHVNLTWLQNEHKKNDKASLYVSVGCYKGKEELAISGVTVHGVTIVVEECLKRALQEGNEYFGIQATTKCYTRKDAGAMHTKSEKVTNCKNGVGGPLAMDMYRLNQGEV